MLDLYVWFAAVALVATTYLASLKLSLISASRVGIDQALTDRGRPDRAQWLTTHEHEAVFAVSLLRTITRMAFFVLVLAEVVQLETATTLTWTHLGLAVLAAAPLTWLFSSVLASALARYAGVNIVVISLPMVKAIHTIFGPLMWAVRVIDEAVRRLSGARLKDDELEREELLQAIEETQREGALDEEAATLLENVVEFSRTDVGEVMTPRTDIEAIEATDDLTVIRQFIADVGHSRIPVYRGDVDHILGVLYVRDLVPYLGTDATDFELEPILRQPIIVPETKFVGELLADFQRSEVHMAIVVDEYGGTAGLVTIEDVLEEIVGEIRDEHEPEGDEKPSLVTIDDSHVEVDGRYGLDDLNEQLALALPEDEEFDTIAGFVLARFGRVPKVGESFEAHTARFTAIKASPRYIERIGIELLETSAAAANGAGRRRRAAENGK